MTRAVGIVGQQPRPPQLMTAISNNVGSVNSVVDTHLPGIETAPLRSR